MVKKIVAIWLSLVMILSFVVIVDVIMDLTPSISGTTHYVNETGTGGAYTKIQDAINASIDGDTVYVYNGTYYENVVVNKSINLVGEHKNNTTIDVRGAGNVIRIIANWVNITGFTLTNSSTLGDFAGVNIFFSCNNNRGL